MKCILEPDAAGDGTHVINHRLEAIHVRGTEDMSTQDVFDYFQGNSPASIEWINDYSCKIKSLKLCYLTLISCLQVMLFGWNHGKQLKPC